VCTGLDPNHIGSWRWRSFLSKNNIKIDDLHKIRTVLKVETDIVDSMAGQAVIMYV
jgi:hypothetical protein